MTMTIKTLEFRKTLYLLFIYTFIYLSFVIFVIKKKNKEKILIDIN